MLLSLLLLSYALVLSFFMGNFIWPVLERVFKTGNKLALHPAIYPIIGLAVMSPIIAVYHFYSKVDLFLHFFFLLFFVSNIKYAKEGFLNLIGFIKNNLLVFLLLILGALLAIIGRPGMGDIADYHLQAIQWVEKYPLLPGLGNFNRPLANNNWWFNLQAFWGFSFLGVKSVYVGNALYFICLFSYLFFAEPISKAQQWMRFLFAAFILLSLKTAFVGAVTPDIIVTGMIYLLLDLYLLAAAKIDLRKGYLLLMVLFILWIVTVKATAIVFFMLPLLWLIQLLKDKQWFFLSKMILLGLVFLIPWFIGNVLLCGYLLYPFNQIDLFAVDWKVPAFYFEFDKIVLSSWGKVPGQDIFLTQKMGIGEWLPIWFGKLDVLNRLLVIGFAICAPLVALFSYKKKEIIWPFSFVLLSFAVIFLNGPHPRFLFGYMLSTIAFALYLFSDKIPFEAPKKFIPLLGLALVLFLSFKAVLQKDLPSAWFEPKPYPHEQLEARNIDGFEVFITKNANSCWDQFPSSYYFIDSVGLRGADIKKGFSVKH